MESAMTKTVQEMVRTFDEPDMQMEALGASALCRRLDFGSVAIGHAVMQPAFRWSKHVKTLPEAAQFVTGELCELRHIGVVLEGTYRFELADGTAIDVHAGEAYDIPEGTPHDEWVVGDGICRAIDVWPQS
jgi:hypothetical protein